MLPEATPTTLPTAVTAVAEATANPRTEIRLTRFPSSIARFGDPRGRNRAPDTGLPNYGSREARARWATPSRGAPRGARAAYDGGMELERCFCGAAPLGVQLCRMRGLTGVRLCRNQAAQGNSLLRVKAHMSFVPSVYRKAAHAPTPPG
ncbi:hypothetical protein GCM10010233_03660 [Streptomyces pseudogriseolus]|nr:hypothetical protein GCM10010233_03660 [Streptomyces gancidicus]